MYPEEFVRPMRQELTGIGFREMRTVEEVDGVLGQEKGTVLVVGFGAGVTAGGAGPDGGGRVDPAVVMREAPTAVAAAAERARATTARLVERFQRSCARFARRARRRVEPGPSRRDRAH